MAWTLTVFDPTGTTVQGVLSEAHSVRLNVKADQLSSVLSFTVDLESTADIALLQPRRVVKVTDGGVDLGGYFVQDMPAVLAEPDELPGVSYTCLSLTSWLGGSRVGGAVVYPYGGVAGKQELDPRGRWDPRRFGPFDADFDDDWWPNAPAAGPLTTEGWPDDQAEALAFTNRALFRRTTPVSGGIASGEAIPARMFLVAQWDVAATVYRNGEPVIEKPWGTTGLFTADIPYDGLGDTIVIQAVKTVGDTSQVVGRVGWTWMRLIPSTDEFGNETFEIGTALRRTFNSVDFPEADSFWLRFNDYQTLPGVTPGFVMKTLVDEAQARGALAGLTYNFTQAVDSASEPWDNEIIHGWRLGSTVGWIAEQLTEWDCNFRVNSSGVLEMFRGVGGTDRSGTVTLDRAEQVSLSGQGVTGNVALLVTPGGVSSRQRIVSVQDYGRVEIGATFGTAVNPLAMDEPARELLSRTAWPRDDGEIALSEVSPQPFVDFDLLDRVSFVARDGSTQIGRVVQVDGFQNDTDGSVDWVVMLDALFPATNMVPSLVTENV